MMINQGTGNKYITGRGLITRSYLDKINSTIITFGAVVIYQNDSMVSWDLLEVVKHRKSELPIMQQS